MIIELGKFKSETKGRNVPPFKEKGTAAGANCYHPTADQSDAKPSVCWGL